MLRAAARPQVMAARRPRGMRENNWIFFKIGHFSSYTVWDSANCTRTGSQPEKHDIKVAATSPPGAVVEWHVCLRWAGRMKRATPVGTCARITKKLPHSFLSFDSRSRWIFFFFFLLFSFFRFYQHIKVPIVSPICLGLWKLVTYKSPHFDQFCTAGPWAGPPTFCRAAGWAFS